MPSPPFHTPPCSPRSVQKPGHVASRAQASEKVATDNWPVYCLLTYVQKELHVHTTARALSFSDAKSPSVYSFSSWEPESRRHVISTMTFSYLGYSNLRSFVNVYFEKQQNIKATGLLYLCCILIFLNPEEGSFGILEFNSSAKILSINPIILFINARQHFSSPFAQNTSS